MQDRKGATLRRGVLILVVLGLLAIPATASAYRFTLATPIANQETVQRALSIEVNLQFAKHWTINPISFAPGGIPIVFLPDVTGVCEKSDSWACHTWDGTQATIYIKAGGWRDEAFRMSHEIMETEVNEHLDRYINGQEVEPCDPAPGVYEIHGVPVSDFVFPRYFYDVPTRGPWDETKDLSRLRGRIVPSANS